MGGDWFLERYTPTTGLTFAVRERLYGGHSDFQHIEVLDTPDYGRVLVLDGCVMLTDRDEFVYHEMITHAPLLLHGSPERVLIIGGGDGGTVREVVRHETVREVHLVEIDPKVTEVSRRFFPALTAQLDHPAVSILHRDGFAYLDQAADHYDAILVDSIDPVGEAAKLFTREFYGKVRRALRPGGVAAFQSESPYFNGEVLRQISAHLRELFRYSAPYTAFIPTYPSGCWCFSFASDAVDPRGVARRDWPGWLGGLRYFNAELLSASFCLPGTIRRLTGA